MSSEVTHAVVSLPRRVYDDLGTHILPDALHEVVASETRVYVIYWCGGRDRDAQFVDPFDGELLAALRFFKTVRAARAWIRQDIAQRAAAAEITVQ